MTYREKEYEFFIMKMIYKQTKKVLKNFSLTDMENDKWFIGILNDWYEVNKVDATLSCKKFL